MDLTIPPIGTEQDELAKETAAAALLEAFADRHRLRVRRVAGDGHRMRSRSDPFIPGRWGQLYAWSGTLLCVMLFGPDVSALRWGNARRAGLAVGMAIVQNGDAEGTLAFDPTNAAQLAVALRVVRALRRPRRQVPIARVASETA